MQALRNKKCVLDTAGASLLHGIKEKPFLIKPNLPEIEFLMKKELRTLRALRDAALFLIGYGAQNVVISMGKYGAMFVNSQATLFAPALMVETRSTVGAGDSTIAGFLVAEAIHAPAEERLRTAVAYGSGACMTQGTRPPKPADIARLLPDVQVTRLK